MYDDPTFHAHISEAVYNLDMSVFADQVFCSIVAEMQTWPQLRELLMWPVLNQATEKASLYRNIAVGHVRRFVWRSQGDADIGLQMGAQNTILANLQDKVAYDALSTLNSTELVQPQTWETLVKWQQRRRGTLKHAMRALRRVLPPDVWQQTAEEEADY